MENGFQGLRKQSVHRETAVLILLFLILVIAFAALVYACFKIKSLARQAESRAVAAETELAGLRQTGSALTQQLTELQTRLHHAIEDPVTHLPGRELFADRMRQNLNECDRYQFNLAVLYIDINDFNVINNALGDETGDAVLLEVSRRLRSCIRQVDTLSRLDKDIFVALLTQLSKPETAAMIARRMLQTLDQPIRAGEHSIYVTASVGIAIYPADAQDASSLLRNANQALTMAKKKGHQVYQFYQEQQPVNSQRDFVLSTHLMNESMLQELEIYYQPIMNVHSHSVFCMETLVRWHHPLLGLIESQEIFIHAEKQGKLNVISEWVLQKACKQFLHWRSLGFEPALLGLSLSFTQLKHPHFIYRVSQIIRELDFKPEWLLLQIKESAGQIGADALDKAFNMLDYLRIKVAIDDFGAEPLSLYCLKHFPANYLKLHPSMIEDIQQNSRARKLVKALAVLGDSLSSPLIIQGVSDEQQLSILSGLGCYLMQGRHLGEPCSEADVMEAQSLR
ncbi:Phytochrome-like protein cph2 [Aquicella siphonis]|uniref:Phytochrome-like protein cph2 n=1 Tax=Aquicella siphonis TaxID=254247 RepID=A0A5E4PEB3_9COXI|nr:bifunctional diguanylate cyclase/phosphodiesterase [Aquicella siphonis]VVC75300.1 Phytochrome-like protein cph2 [Aquicella siphonis]